MMDRILLGIVVVVIIGAGFGPVWVASQNQKNLLTVQCANAAYNVQELTATKLTLKAVRAIAHDLNLPVAVEIDAALQKYPIPEVPPECSDA